jgi:hypothetical protein
MVLYVFQPSIGNNTVIFLIGEFDANGGAGV